MKFSEWPASRQWATLKFKGHMLAEAWFKPEGEPLDLLLRFPRSSFAIPEIGQRLTIEMLLKAVAIAPEEVASCRYGGASQSGLQKSPLELKDYISPPPQGVDYVEICIRMQAAPQTVVPQQNDDSENASAKWQDLEARWKGLLGLEATMDTLRMSMEGLRIEMEASMKRMLTGEEKHHALSSDVAQWNRTKSRVHYVLPKASEFIHRAVWAKSTPERKRLDDIFKSSTATDFPVAQTDQVLEELEIVRKDRQLLTAQGVAVYQECKCIFADVQGALRRLQGNATARALKKKGTSGQKGKGF